MLNATIRYIYSSTARRYILVKNYHSSTVVPNTSWTHNLLRLQNRMECISSEKQKTIFIVNGFMFRLHKTSKDEVRRWICCKNSIMKSVTKKCLLDKKLVTVLKGKPRMIFLPNRRDLNQTNKKYLLNSIPRQPKNIRGIRFDITDIFIGQRFADSGFLYGKKQHCRLFSLRTCTNEYYVHEYTFACPICKETNSRRRNGFDEKLYVTTLLIYFT